MKMNEVTGTGNWNTAEFWEYATRSVHRANPDPLKNTWESPYAVFGSNPIMNNDVNGDCWNCTPFPHFANSISNWWNEPTSNSYAHDLELKHGVSIKTNGQLLMWSMASSLEHTANNSMSTGGPNGTKSFVVTNSKSSATTSALSNTGTKLQVGTYKDMTKAYAKTGLSADHIPSFGSLKRQQELLLGRPLTKSEATTLKNQSYTMVYESHIHQQSSRTYGGRNTRDKQMNDALDPVNAIKKDIQALSPMLLNKGYSREDINNAQLNLLSKFGVNVKSESKSSSIKSPFGP